MGTILSTALSLGHRKRTLALVATALLALVALAAPGTAVATDWW